MPAKQQKMIRTRQGRIDTRKMRGSIDAAELWRRAQHAAAVELGGTRWTPEQREQVAAEIVERTLQAIAGESPPVKIDRRKLRGSSAYQRARHAEAIELAAPWRNGIAAATSERVSFIRLARLAKDRRESMELAAAHRASADAAADRPADGGAVVQTIGSIGQERDADSTAAVAAAFIARTGLDPDSERHRALAWSFARDLPDGRAQRGTLATVEVAAELKMTPGAYRVALNRARADLAKLYPDPAHLLAAIVGHAPVARVDPLAVEDVHAARAALAAGDESVPHMLTYNPSGQPWPTFPEYVVTARGELDVRPSRDVASYREGTGPDGTHVKRHADLAAARAAVRLVKKGDRRKARKRSAAEIRRARRALAAAYRDEQRHRDGNRGLAFYARDPGEVAPPVKL